MTNWISVKEHIPDNDRYVLIVLAEKSYPESEYRYQQKIGYYSQRLQRWEWEPSYRSLNNIDVTHWLELPEMPKDE